MPILKKNKLAVVMGSLILVSQISESKDTEPAQFEFGGGAAYFLFDNDFDVEDKLGLRAYGGFRVNRWGFELVYDRVDTEWDFGGDFDIRQTYINALFHGDMIGKFEPYVGAGWGQGEFSSGSQDNESTVTNFGVGGKYYFSKNWALRPSLNYFLPTEFDDGYASFALTVSYLVGGSAHKTKSKKPVTAAPKPLDSDKDGVLDSRDQCPNTPMGVNVDSVGCPIDTDGDGVFDHLDKCPETAAKLKVDENGCPVVLKETVEIDLKVNFDSNSAVVKAEYYPEIRGVATFLEQYENTKVVIEGHTDTRGSAAYNKSLSQKRADAVAKVLVSDMGVAAKRVSSVGYGEERPIADDSTKEGQMANRRVVAKVSATVEKLEQN